VEVAGEHSAARDRRGLGELNPVVIADLDASDDEQRDVPLPDLLCAAWGRVLAQHQ
jgi:hypothetical protein